MIVTLLNAPVLAMRWKWLNWPANARRTLTFVFLVFVNWLFLTPASTFKDVHIFLSHQDKLVHFGIFCALTGLIRWSIPGHWGEGKMRIVLILTLLAYGTGIECLQPLMPGAGRSFEWMDLLLDGIGVAFGGWVCEQLARKKPA